MKTSDLTRQDVFLLTIVLLLVVTIMLYLLMCYNVQEAHTEAERLQVMVEHLEAEKDALTEARDALELKLEEQVTQEVDRQEKILQKMERWLQTWEVKEVETTMYAPLDPAAVEGVCFAGNPNITASGAQVVPGVTVAAGPSVPFGSRVWIEGYGWRVVQDRGSRITDRHIDIAVSDKKTATMFGRQKRLVVMERGPD